MMIKDIVWVVNAQPMRYKDGVIGQKKNSLLV